MSRSPPCAWCWMLYWHWGRVTGSPHHCCAPHWLAQCAPRLASSKLLPAPTLSWWNGRQTLDMSVWQSMAPCHTVDVQHYTNDNGFNFVSFELCGSTILDTYIVNWTWHVDCGWIFQFLWGLFRSVYFYKEHRWHSIACHVVFLALFSKLFYFKCLSVSFKIFFYTQNHSNIKSSLTFFWWKIWIKEKKVDNVIPVSHHSINATVFEAIKLSNIIRLYFHCW